MNDLRLALRSLRTQPLFAAVAIVTLALGIGATTTLFTIVNAVLLRPLPYPDAGRIVSVSDVQGGNDLQVVPAPDYFEWAKASHSFDALAIYGGLDQVLTGRGEPASIYGAAVSARYFSVLEVRPALGRVFRADEDVPGAPRRVVLAHEFWEQRFGSDSAVLGQSISLDGNPYTVIGVMPAGFASPRGARYWVARQLDPAPASGVTFYFSVVGRLKPGVDVARAQSELSALNRRVELRMPPAPGAAAGPPAALVMTLHDRMFGSTRPALLMLLGAVGFLLLIACANVANLLLARAASRQREFAVRVALGATRWRLARQLLLESVVVSVLGGAFGLLIPLWLLAYFVRISPTSVARVENIHVNGTVLAFAAGVSLLTGIGFGLMPALMATRADGFHSLKEGGAHAAGTAGQRRARQVLIVAELATALMLLTGAGLLTRSFARARATTAGFRPEHLLTVDLYLRGDRYDHGTASTAFFERLAERVRAFSGVQSVGYSNASTLAYRMTVVLPLPGTATTSPPIAMSLAGPQWMRTEGLELTAGRLLDARDRAGAPGTVVLSTSAAHLLFPHEPAVGQTMSMKSSGGGTQTVVGVVEDVQLPGADTPRLPQIYAALAQGSDGPAVLSVRYTGDAAALETAIRHAITDMDPMQLDYTISTMDVQLGRLIAPRRFNSVVIDVFAALALVLAAVGLYGVMAYQVAQRTQELGIRMALGADRARVLRFVLRDGMRLALLGTAIGVALSLGLSRFMAGLLFGVAPRDLTTFVAVPAVMITVALLACYLPARRATKVDPVVALRYE